MVVCYCVCVCPLGVPAQLLAQGPPGRGEGPVQRGATLGGSAHPDRSQTQAEGGQTSGKLRQEQSNGTQSLSYCNITEGKPVLSDHSASLHLSPVVLC